MTSTAPLWSDAHYRHRQDSARRVPAPHAIRAAARNRPAGTGRPRIHVILDTEELRRPSACAALRLVDPFSYPVITDAFDVSIDIRPALSPVDVLVMQRLGPPGMPEPDVETLVRSLKAAGTRLWYDLDDNLLDTHPEGLVDSIIAGRRRLIRFLLRRADRVTVSTAALSDRVRHLNPRVTVLPNAVDERRLPTSAPPRPPKTATMPASCIKIGYFGTLTHTRDVMAVAGPLRAALSCLRGGPTLVLCGISPDVRVASLFDGVAPIETLPVTGDYESFVRMMLHQADWDVGLAPLAAGEFESAKSDIKFLEYAAFGIPGLYSTHPAYATVRHGVTGMLAAPEQWASTLRTMLDDAELRARIVAASRDYLFSERTLAASIHGWVTVLDEMLGGHDDTQ